MPIELTILGDVLRGIGMVYWAIAIAAILAALLKPPGWKYKAAMTGLVIAIFGFLPATHWWEKRQQVLFAQEAWAYFKKLCAEKAGERVYKQQVGVKSVFVSKPLPPATEKDLYDQYWYGDPYSASATSWRSIDAAAKFVYPDAPVAIGKLGSGLEFVEMRQPNEKGGGDHVVLIQFDQTTNRYKTSPISKETSAFDLSWEDISRPEDRKYWVAGSRLTIRNRSDNAVIAERLGFLIEPNFGSTAGQRRPWSAAVMHPNASCPQAHPWIDRWFVLKVLNPNS